MNINDILARRTDLSTFLVHLTRTSPGAGNTGKERLKSIITDDMIRAISPMGHAVDALVEKNIPTDSQKCVAFTETPLEQLMLLVGPIDGRTIELESYGVAITKRLGRSKGVNPVWYLDITPAGHDWLSNHVNALVDEAIEPGPFEDSDIAALTPFIEQMGQGRGAGYNYRKEFWWEREWRHRGDFTLPNKLILLCPESEIGEFKEHVAAQDFPPSDVAYVDPKWSLEKIIARLAGFDNTDIDLL